jgi:hypothetical protein
MGEPLFYLEIPSEWIEKVRLLAQDDLESAICELFFFME